LIWEGRKGENQRQVVMSGNMNDHNYNAVIYGNDREAQELFAVINSLPDIRNDRIESVRRCIESGTYRIHSGKIAERILEEGFSRRG
jgi:anti-sigma28 factor (negative regulator of flagellin synthesis)